MLYSDFSIDLVLKRMAEVFNKKSTPTRICGVLLEAMEIIQQLRRAAIPSPNDPLTLDELRKMNGEPVWIKVKNSECFADVLHNVAKSEGRIYIRLVNHWYLQENGYGKTWLAYRRKPEEVSL